MPETKEQTEDARTPVLLLNATEAADALSIGTRKLWELTNCGDIPCVRIGRAVRYDPEDLKSWIQRNKTRGPAWRHCYGER